MPEPAQFQHRFSIGLIRGRGPRWLHAPGGAVYSNTWVKALLDALDANYPVVAALLGPELFKTVAVAYAKSHPASTPILALYGGKFPQVLEAHDLSQGLPYLGDVARLERLWTECFFAPDAPPLDLSDVSELSQGRALALQPRLHPSVRLGRFDTPAVTIWTAHQDGDFDELEPVWRSEKALVVRTHGSVQVREIGEHELGLLAQFQKRRSLGPALETMASKHPAADPTATLSMTISMGALTLAAHAGKD
jgi:hypothetical protein